MPQTHKQPLVGQVDISGREIVYLNSKGDGLSILLDSKGDLVLVSLSGVIPVIVKGEPELIFKLDGSGVGFSLKASGKKYYFGEGTKYSLIYKMDYDDFGNMIVRVLTNSKLIYRYIFMSRLTVFAIKRKRDSCRRAIKKRKRRNNDE